MSELSDAIRRLTVSDQCPSKRRCRFFLTSRGCSKGAACDFRHGTPSDTTFTSAALPPRSLISADAQKGASRTLTAPLLSHATSRAHLATPSTPDLSMWSKPAGLPSLSQTSAVSLQTDSRPAADPVLSVVGLKEAPPDTPSPAPPRADAPCASPHLLYVDALNFGSEFFNLHEPYNWALPLRRVIAFSDAAKATAESVFGCLSTSR